MREACSCSKATPLATKAQGGPSSEKEESIFLASVACVAGERCDLPRSPQISPDLGRLRCGRALREVELELLRDL